ncbi:DNA-binding domain protein [Vibrio phage 1.161.O._10N.261.48.C5]|nr:DNA-binding domain protein [Vibrio phage 1.161.O._10N.261.48.C5]
MILNFGVNDIPKCKSNLKYYQKWYDMIQRCYNTSQRSKYPTYTNCEVCQEWRYFSNFLNWCKAYEVRTGIDCKDYALDKDVMSSVTYSPESCCFLPKNVNTFLSIKRRNNTLGYVGVSYQKSSRLYKAEINAFFERRRICLGYFKDARSASIAYKEAKLGIASRIVIEGLLSYDLEVEKVFLNSVENLLETL